MPRRSQQYWGICVQRLSGQIAVTQSLCGRTKHPQIAANGDQGRPHFHVAAGIGLDGSQCAHRFATGPGIGKHLTKVYCEP